MESKEAIERLAVALQSDPDYVWAWHFFKVGEAHNPHCAQRVESSGSTMMTEQRAREILGDAINADDHLWSGVDAFTESLRWPYRGSMDAYLEGKFTADMLEAIAWWMRNKKQNEETDEK